MSFRTVFSNILISIKAVVLNKYLIVLVSFAIYMTFFDRYNLIQRWQLSLKMRELNEEYKYYQGEIDKNRKELYRLQHDDDYLEQFAREKYLLRNRGEEIFIIKEE